MSDLGNALLSMMKGEIESAYAEEFGADWKELLDCVDLSVAHSPVIPRRVDSLSNVLSYVCDATPTRGGDYLVQGSYVSPESLKVMRLRYLLAYKEQQRRQWAPLSKKIAEAAPRANTPEPT